MAYNLKEGKRTQAPPPIPEGWILTTKTKRNGSQIECYLCPETKQCFYSYHDLMRYVTYAKREKLSIYSPDFKADKKKPNSKMTSECESMNEESQSSCLSEI